MTTTPPSPTPTPKKATKAEALQRVEEVMLIRMSGAGLHDLREYAREKKWGVTDGQLYRYMQQADDRIADSLAKDRPRLFELHVARRRMLFARCVESGDWRAALAVIRDEALLFRLYEGRGQSPAGGPPVEGGGDVVKLLGERLRQVSAADLPVGDKAKLTAALADAYLRAVAAVELEGRVEALERAQSQRGEPR
jgi:hypothetical protein